MCTVYLNHQQVLLYTYVPISDLSFCSKRPTDWPPTSCSSQACKVTICYMWYDENLSRSDILCLNWIYIWRKIFQGGTGNPLLDMYSQYAAAAYSPQVGGLHRLNCYSYILIFYSLFHPPLHDFLSPVPLWQVISSANDASGDPGAPAGTHHLAGAAAAPATSPIPCGR